MICGVKEEVRYILRRNDAFIFHHASRFPGHSDIFSNVRVARGFFGAGMVWYHTQVQRHNIISKIERASEIVIV